MKQVSRINQSDDMPSMAAAVGRETSTGAHIIYLDSTLSRVIKRLRLRTVMRALGWGAAKRDAVIAGFVAWKVDGKAKTATTTVVVIAVAASVATLAGLTTGHHGSQQPLQRPSWSGPVLPLSKSARAPLSASQASPARSSVSVSGQPADVMSYAPAEQTAQAASSDPAPSGVQPSPEPGTPSKTPPAAPSTPRAGGSSGGAAHASEGGVCVDVAAVVNVCVG